jgi:hypothetical protein
MSDMYSSTGNTARLAPGTKLNGIFEIDRHIASGGMGDIYRGHAIETNDEVAIKVMRTDLADNTMALALFRKEASALHYIHHDAIVRYFVFSLDPETQRHYLAMEFVDGQPLSDILKEGPLAFDAVCHLQRGWMRHIGTASSTAICHPITFLFPTAMLASPRSSTLASRVLREAAMARLSARALPVNSTTCRLNNWDFMVETCPRSRTYTVWVWCSPNACQAAQSTWAAAS